MYADAVYDSNMNSHIVDIQSIIFGVLYFINDSPIWEWVIIHYKND